MNTKEEKELIELFLEKDITIEELIKKVSDSVLDEGYDLGFRDGCIETERKVCGSIYDIRANLDDLEDGIL